tara:strand:+ start:502 stop:678 length:177 start_codon:yes stop_codon:yes gene_type:complete
MIHNVPIYENSAEFIVFLRWLRDKWELEGNNTDILDVVQSPYKFVDEMKEYRENVTYN